MVNGSRYYRALESVSIAYVLFTALTHARSESINADSLNKLLLPTARKKEWRPATAGSSPHAVTCEHCDTHYVSRHRIQTFRLLVIISTVFVCVYNTLWFAGYFRGRAQRVLLWLITQTTFYNEQRESPARYDLQCSSSSVYHIYHQHHVNKIRRSGFETCPKICWMLHICATKSNRLKLVFFMQSAVMLWKVVRLFVTSVYLINHFYRAMHFRLCKARYSDRMSSVSPSVCPSVTLVNCDHIGWNSSKLISPLVSLGRSLFATLTWRVCSMGNTPKFGPIAPTPCWFERRRHSIANCGRMVTDSATVTMESL